MFTWAEVALLFLKLANMFLAQINSATLIKAGTDAEIARASASILLKTKAAKAIMEEVSAMSGDHVDLLLRQLEPGD